MRRLGVLALAVALVAACAACGGGSDGDAREAGTGSVAEPAGVSLEGTTLDGEALSVEELRGKPVFVNVWASW
jgi:hypothetical protein